MSANRFALVCLMTLVAPDVSLAHTPVQGINNFYNGLLHPVLVTSHLLLLVAVGLFWGQQGPKAIKPTLGIFVFATVTGLTAAWFTIGTGFETFILVLSAVIGLLIAINTRVALLWCWGIALLAGFLLGIDSAQEALSGKEKLVTLFGNGVAIYFLVLYPMALADYFNNKTWQKIGIRIVGSWIAASSLIVLALMFSAKP